ncbi:MAG: DUF721 domain-containing protein [Paracoccaceae bacterium]
MTDREAGRDTGPKPAPRRRMRGFEPASGLLAGAIRKAGEARGFAVSRLLTHWAEIAGADVAAFARPVRIGYGKGGFGATLTLLCAGPSAPVLQMRLPAIRERVNACYGYNAVSRIVITQSSALGLAEDPAPFGHTPRRLAPAPSPAAAAEARALSGPVADDGLRAALAALGEKVLSRPRPSPGATPVAPTPLAPTRPSE